MEVIKIVGTDDTPSVTLDVANEIFEISGRSLPEDVAVFYEPILDWIDRYSEEATGKTIFNFKLVYFNTASSKMILDILLKLEEMHEAGKEYADIVDVPFEQISYSLD